MGLVSDNIIIDLLQKQNDLLKKQNETLTVISKNTQKTGKSFDEILKIALDQIESQVARLSSTSLDVKRHLEDDYLAKALGKEEE